ncbi:MAG: glycosyltransferase family 2 protein [Cyclobacteriaceae bacterium]|nr:glycosyltransferase family 2 protein [Cyclobacteriaceae bacterium]
MIDLSVVIPLYNEEESLPELCDWISRVTTSHGFSYEILLINDGSTDDSWKVIEGICSQNKAIKAVKFNRNYGKSAALDTGFKLANGQVIITMDADMQDSPDEIPELYRMIAEDGLDMVSGWKKKRHDPITKTVPSRFFNATTRMISGIKLHDFNCGLKAYKSDVVKNIKVYGEMHRYIPVIAKWHGFTKIGEKVVEHRKRKYGTTKFGIERFIYGFLDLLSITFVSKFKRRPMHFFGLLGTLSFFFGLLSASWLIWKKLEAIYILKVPVTREVVDQPLFFLALVAIIVGVQLFMAGFIGELLVINKAEKEEYLIIESIGLS